MFRTILTLLIFCAAINAQGLFESQSDIGEVLHPGTAEFNAGTNRYTVTGSGENMWFAKDEFHFLWKKVSSDDVALTASIKILGDAAEGHRKAVLMIRQSLDTDSAYVDAARHAEGLTSLQFREHKGETTREVESNTSGPATLRIEKHGNLFYLWIGPDKDNLEFAGGSARVEMHAPFYIGLGVCAHKKEAVEAAEFSDVSLSTEAARTKTTYSTIETVLKSGDARVAYVSKKHVTNAAWSPDGHALTFEADGEAQQSPFMPLRTAAPVGDPVTNEKPAVDLTCPDLCTLQLGTKVLTTFEGNKDSLSKQPWSPDGRRIAFISYQVAPH